MAYMKVGSGKMNCVEWRKELQNWLESQWATEDGSHEAPEHLKMHAAECSQCAVRLKASILLVNGKELRKVPSKELAQQINERLAQEEWSHSNAWLRWTVIPAVAALIVGLIVFSTLKFIQPSRADTVVVHLKLDAPGAQKVSVVGDWNGWNPASNQLTDKDRDGIWEIKLRLKRGGEFQYQFLINEEKWIPDPNTPLQVEDGLGGVNSILQI
jgi:hypothetical protein